MKEIRLKSLKLYRNICRDSDKLLGGINYIRKICTKERLL